VLSYSLSVKNEAVLLDGGGMKFSLVRRDTRFVELNSLARDERVFILTHANKKLSAKKGSHFLFSVEKEDAIAISLIEEYEKLYKHYDNQRASFAQILVLVSAGLIAAPFVVGKTDFTIGILVVLCAKGIIVLSLVGLFFLYHIRKRMKKMQKRSQFLQCKLIEDSENCSHQLPEDAVRVVCCQLTLSSLMKRADRKAKCTVEKDGFLSLNRRSTLWDFIPIVAILYSFLFLIFGIGMIVGS